MCAKLFIIRKFILLEMLPSSQQQSLPLITVGVVVFNREWIIGQMLDSLKRQTYPHDKIFLLIVDGESKDKTVKVANQSLTQSDFSGYEVIVKDTNIPEARNICIQKMKGDYLFFWDSDVIMEPSAIENLLNILRTENADIVSACITQVNVDSVDEIEKKWHEWETKYPRQNEVKIVDVIATGNAIISKKVLSQISFDPDCTYFEDQEFASHANRQGFKIMQAKNVIGFDINSRDQKYSDIYACDMPVKKMLRGLRKKGKIQAERVTLGFSSVSKALTKFFWANKRYLFYLLYIPAIILTVIGVLILNLWLILVFPAYFLLYTVFQLRKRGFVRGLKTAERSLIVGVPTTYALVYYCMKLGLRKPKVNEQKS